MQLTAELSLYPLQDNYLPVIKSFIDDLAGQDQLLVISNAMSTQLRGDFEIVMTAVSQVLRRSCEQFGRQVLVCKFIPGSLDIDQAITAHA